MSSLRPLELSDEQRALLERAAESARHDQAVLRNPDHPDHPEIAARHAAMEKRLEAMRAETARKWEDYDRTHRITGNDLAVRITYGLRD